MSQVTPAHGPHTAFPGCLHQCLSYSTLHSHLLVRRKKAGIELPPHICFPFSNLLPCPAAWIILTQCLLCYAFLPHPLLAPLHSLFSFTSCTLTSAPPPLTNSSRQPEVEVFMATSLPGNPAPHNSLGNSRLHQAVQPKPPF